MKEGGRIVKLSDILKQKLDKEGQEIALTMLEAVTKEHKGKSQKKFQKVLGVIKDFGESNNKISFDGGSQWVDFKEAADLSMEEIKDKIKEQLRTELAPARAYPWVAETHQDYVIVEIEREGQDGGFYQYEYEVNDDETITVGEPIEVQKVVTWEPVDEPEMVESKTSEEMEVKGEFIPLTEAKKSPVIDKNGKAKIKLIQPGWGESAYYPADVLARDCKIFEGAKMYWNHPTADEEKQRPEGDLNNLAGIINSKPTYEENGPKGAGVYADVEVFDAFREPVEELANHIGVSIRAGGKAKTGKIENREGKIAEAITASKSVDFVTEPGAGGEIIPLFEAAGRGEWSEYTETQNITINNNKEGEQEMKIEDLTVEKLKESRQDLVDELMKEAKPQEPQDNTELKEAQSKIDKLEEKLMLRESAEIIKSELEGVKLPQKTKTRLLKESLASTPETDEGELDKEKLVESVKGLIKEAQEELKEAIGGIKNMGESHQDFEESEEDVEKADTELTESFTRLLGDEKKAKVASFGR